jgi:hypothetical protein
MSFIAHARRPPSRRAIDKGSATGVILDLPVARRN